MTRVYFAVAVVFLSVGCASGGAAKRATSDAPVASTSIGEDGAYPVFLPLTADAAFSAVVQALANLEYPVRMASVSQRKLQTGNRFISASKWRKVEELTVRLFIVVEPTSSGEAVVRVTPEFFKGGHATSKGAGSVAGIIQTLRSEIDRVIEFGERNPELESAPASTGESGD